MSGVAEAPVTRQPLLSCVTDRLSYVTVGWDCGQAGFAYKETKMQSSGSSFFMIAVIIRPAGIAAGHAGDAPISLGHSQRIQGGFLAEKLLERYASGYTSSDSAEVLSQVPNTGIWGSRRPVGWAFAVSHPFRKERGMNGAPEVCGWGEMRRSGFCGFPPIPPNHPNDEDLSLGTPICAE